MNKSKVAGGKPLPKLGEIEEHLNKVYDLVFEDYSFEEFEQEMSFKERERPLIFNHRLVLFHCIDEARNVFNRLKMLQEKLKEGKQ